MALRDRVRKGSARKAPVADSTAAEHSEQPVEDGARESARVEPRRLPIPDEPGMTFTKARNEGVDSEWL